MATAVENGAGGDEQEVRWVDQERINEFGCLNNRLNELRADLHQITEDMEKLDDATSEMMLSTNGKFMILMGEAFIECDEDYITEYCEEKIETLKSRKEKYLSEEKSILARQKILKEELYGRFGSSINLET